MDYASNMIGAQAITGAFRTVAKTVAMAEANVRTRIVTAVETVQMDQIEDIHEYALPPWTPRIQVMLESDKEKAVKAANDAKGIVTATSSSQRNGVVGMGGVVRSVNHNRLGVVLASYSVCLGTAEEQNPYTAELAAIAMALMLIKRPREAGL
ncbi:uncharacterized protein HRG_06758 [Hirsutella rhossiliensis]|uniref:RNase H type-1 domain-containing protein n=1 Tax=Hirsutella rhossiliensis TaxID=111463 RepID=A0A9P8SHB1_9HYPO|nr:uncharacterized protein HRG_06758 [Hirsutella rhossiliensis]KAH0962656.1 hypothetical protein HRG_06758 [Hirsutella rhossiliensis]